MGQLMTQVWLAAGYLVLGLILAGCSNPIGASQVGTNNVLDEVPGGNPEAGKRIIEQFGCGTCHVIPGVRGANGHVGPPLTQFAKRRYIAGNLTNTPDNLIRWLVDPPAVEPGTAMPDLGLNEAVARDVAAYLSTLE